jgi:hypothetical protein
MFTVVYGCLAVIGLYAQTLMPSGGAETARVASSVEPSPGIAGLISLATYDLASSE